MGEKFQMSSYSTILIGRLLFRGKPCCLIAETPFWIAYTMYTPLLGDMIIPSWRGDICPLTP